MADAILKRCTRCGETKPASMFSPRKQSKGGLYSWCKPCSAECARAWAANNKDRISARNKAVYWADPEAARAKRTAYYRSKGGGAAKPAQTPSPDANGVLTLKCSKCEARLPVEAFYWREKGRRSTVCKECTESRNAAYVVRNKDRVTAYKKMWAQENADRLREQKKANYEANRAERVMAAKEWQLQNPEKRRAIAQNYKHRRRAQEDGGISSADLAAWKKAQPKVCHWCGKKCARDYTVDHYLPLAKGGKHEADNFVIACRACNVSKNAKLPEEFAASLGRLL